MMITGLVAARTTVSVSMISNCIIVLLCDYARPESQVVTVRLIDRILVAPTELSSYSNAVQQSFAFLQGANTAAALAVTYDALND